MGKQQSFSKPEDAWVAVPQMEELELCQVIENLEEHPIRERQCSEVLQPI